MASIREVKTVCTRVAESLPTGLVQAANDRAAGALALLTAEFTGSTAQHAVEELGSEFYRVTFGSHDGDVTTTLAQLRRASEELAAALTQAHQVLNELRAYARQIDTVAFDNRLPGPIPVTVVVPAAGMGGSHGPQMRRGGVGTGPVRFRLPDGVTDAERTQALEYVEAANRALRHGRLSHTGRVRVEGELKQEKDRAARRERLRAEAAGEPYGDDVAAHLPDTTWTGTAEPPEGWGRHTTRINTSLGSQSGKYPEGYAATGFDIEVDS